MGIFKKPYRQYTDEDLISLIAKKDIKAFDEIYDRHAQLMYAYFIKMLYQDRELAADFSQALFLKIFEKAYTFDHSRRFSTWLYTLASNMCKNEYRRQSRTRPTIFLEDFMKQTAAKGPTIIDSQIFNESLQQAINNLDEKHRLCFVLRYQDDKTIEEISNILDCPQGTVKSRLHYSLKKLATALEAFRSQLKKLP